MSREIGYEAWLLLLSLLMGVWQMMVYDCLRVLRLMFRHNSFWVGMEDFFYWCYAGLSVFMLLYEQNDGSLRAYVIAGVFFGMAAYDRLISRILFRSLKKAGKCFKIAGRKLGRFWPFHRTSRTGG